jgi:methanogen homoaconitase small subunit
MANIWKFGSDIDTDQIVPGRYAPYMRPNDDVGDAAFIEARPDFAKRAKPDDIIIAAHNFGCGSSREYAALALKRRQVGAIIAISFARIFFRNALNLGIPLFTHPEIVNAVSDGDLATINIEQRHLMVKGQSFDLPPLPIFAQEILAAGGIVPYVKTHGHFPGLQE